MQNDDTIFNYFFNSLTNILLVTHALSNLIHTWQVFPFKLRTVFMGLTDMLIINTVRGQLSGNVKHKQRHTPRRFSNCHDAHKQTCQKPLKSCYVPQSLLRDLQTFPGGSAIVLYQNPSK